MMKKIIAILAVAWVLSLLVVTGTYAAETGKKPIAVLDLYNEFQKDPQAAANAYQGKNIVVTGIVRHTGPDIHGTPAIELSDAAGGKIYAVCVVGTFDQLEGVSIGETVTMSGNFHIFVLDEWGVVLKQSEIL